MALNVTFLCGNMVVWINILKSKLKVPTVPFCMDIVFTRLSTLFYKKFSKNIKILQYIKEGFYPFVENSGNRKGR